MQKYLKNILSDPPYGLGKISNFLLLVSAVLLLSIFFMDPQDEEISLTHSIGKPEVVKIPGASQLSARQYGKLFTIVEEGATITKGDTIFSTLSASEVKTLSSWRRLIKVGNLKPTAEMLRESFVNPKLKKKLIDLARAQVKPAKPKRTKPNNGARVKKLKEQIDYYKKEIDDFQAAVDKFKDLEKDYDQKLSVAQDKYARNEIELTELKSVQKKWKEMMDNRKMREDQLKRPKGILSELISEYDYIKQHQVKLKIEIDDVDNTPYESDIALSLDSLWRSSFVVSKYDGKIESFGKLVDISIGEEILKFSGSETQILRSKTILAEANPRDANRVFPGRELYIYLQDGSIVNGEIIDTMPNEDYHFKIAATEELSTVDIEQIILPSINDNFIEKVLENF